MSKNAEPTPQGGVHSVQNWNRRGGNHADWGRPELESYTPVNIGNGPYRDNGEGVAATPLPYPLEDACFREVQREGRGEGSGSLACLVARGVGRRQRFPLLPSAAARAGHNAGGLENQAT